MYKAEITHKEDLSFLVKAEGDEFIVDAKGKAITPPSALLVSLGSCLGVYIRKYAEGLNWIWRVLG
ncbi:MAG TPA: hypothetical protein VMD04_04785 [Candidatus Margulisiibacteriota bacterium]|nr:hypothetical protein [Candidatus Margulisiibacteriota bacterium]